MLSCALLPLLANSSVWEVESEPNQPISVFIGSVYWIEFEIIVQEVSLCVCVCVYVLCLYVWVYVLCVYVDGCMQVFKYRYIWSLYAFFSHSLIRCCLGQCCSFQLISLILLGKLANKLQATT